MFIIASHMNVQRKAKLLQEYALPNRCRQLIQNLSTTVRASMCSGK